MRDRLKNADWSEMAIEVICRALIQKLSSFLMIAIEDLDSKKPVVVYGLDSSVAGEFRNWITADLNAIVSFYVTYGQLVD